MKRKSLKGIGLNGKGQGANALLKGLRKPSPLDAESTPKQAQPPAPAPEIIPAQTHALAPEVQVVSAPQPAAAPPGPPHHPLPPPEPEKPEQKPVPVKPEPENADFQPAPATDKDAGVPSLKSTALESIPPAPPSARRVKCTYYLNSELERALNRVQAQSKLADRNIEKSTIVSEALRRYLPQVAQHLPPRDVSSPKSKSSGRVKRTYYLDANVARSLNRVQAQYQLEGQQVEKSELINAALRQYLPQVKADLGINPQAQS